LAEKDLKMLTDSIFEQGVTHEVCEDYALHGDGWVVVSDGCSSGEFTDWGSRLLCKAAEQHLSKQCQHPMQFYQAVGATVLTQARTFVLPANCLTATLLTAQREGDNIKAIAIGDGIVGGKRRDGRWKIHVIDFPTPLGSGGAPFYLKYDIFNETDQWLARHGSDYKITTYFGNIMSPEMEFPEGATFEKRCEDWSQFVSEFINDDDDIRHFLQGGDLGRRCIFIQQTIRIDHK
jgi:hypothetical protein